MAEIALNTTLPIVNDDGTPTLVMQNWMTLVSRLAPLTGSGSPETNVEAPQHRFYWDETGNALYFKESTDISGDASRGWIAV